MPYYVYLNYDSFPGEWDFVKITKEEPSTYESRHSSWNEAKEAANKLRKEKQAKYLENQEDMRPRDDYDEGADGITLDFVKKKLQEEETEEYDQAQFYYEYEEDRKYEPTHAIYINRDAKPGDCDYIKIAPINAIMKEDRLTSIYAPYLETDMNRTHFFDSPYWEIYVSKDCLTLDADKAYTIRCSSDKTSGLGRMVCIAIAKYENTAERTQKALTEAWRLYRPENKRPEHPEIMKPEFSWLDLSDNNFRSAMIDARGYDRNRWLTIIAGSGGSGKSEIYKAVYADDPAHTLPMALTGFASDTLRDAGVTTCMTINKALLIEPQPWYDTSDEIPDLARRIACWDTLLIDEVSMAGINFMDMLIRHINKANQIRPKYKNPIKVVLFGDPLQLLPVIDKESTERFDKAYGQDRLFFNAPAFKAISRKTHILHYSYRQKNDPVLSKILLDIRLGKVTQEDADILNTRVMDYEKLASLTGNQKLRMLAYDNKSVDRFNTEKGLQMDQLRKEKVAHITHYKMYVVSPTDEKSLYSAWPDCITLYKGDPVMMLKNDNFHSGLDSEYSNGTTGIVVDFTETGLPIIEKANGKRFTVYRTIIKGRNERFSQLPCKPAYAVTYHKAQGLTLDQVYLDLGRYPGAMQEDMLYLGISRVRTLKGLGISRRLSAKELNESLNKEAMQYFRMDNAERDAIKSCSLKFTGIATMAETMSYGHTGIFATKANTASKEKSK